MRLSWALGLLWLVELPASAHGQTAHAAANPHPTQTASSAATANDVEVARVHFKNGVDSYRDGDLSTALIEFKRAYAAAKNYRLLFNLGQVSDELRDYTEAERYFREYLREGGDEIDAARRQDVQATLTKVTGRIAALVLTTNATGATFYVDDAAVGDAPVRDPVRVSAGRRRVSATLAGRPRVTEMVDAAGGETVVVHLEFPPALANSPSVPAPPTTDVTAAERSNPAVLWLGIGSGVLAVSTAVMAYLAYQDGADYRAALERKTTHAELDDLQSQAKTKALVTDILLGATVVATGLTLYIALSHDSESRPEQRAAQLRIGPGSLSMRAAF
jgi:tetratricopeptide (TPR) repeat protein